MLRRVREQLRGAEVGDRLDRRRRALGQVDDQFDRQVAACHKAFEGGPEAFGEGRGMDPPGQVTQFGDRLHRPTVGGVDQLQGPVEVGALEPGGRGAEMVSSEPELHDDGDHLGLRSVVQILLDTPQPGCRVVHHQSPGSLQLTHALDILGGIPQQVPARDQVGERAVQRGRHEENQPPPVPERHHHRARDHDTDRGDPSTDRHALHMTRPERREGTPGGRWSHPGRFPMLSWAVHRDCLL